MGIRIDQIDTSTEPESVLRELAVYYAVLEAEEMPGDPPTPFEQRIADWRNVSVHYPDFRWVLRDEDRICAVAVAAFDRDQNLDNGYGRVHVHPEMRGRGYARAIAGPMFDLLQSEGRRRFDTMIVKDAPAETLARALGLKSVFKDQRSRVTLAELDMGLMDSWIERSRERALDYELVHYQSPLPDDVVERFCELVLVMNTAPREAFEEDDVVLTPAAWRELESHVIDSKCQLHNLIAVHKPTGEFAGYTQVKTQDLQPDLAWNWDTAVDPGHRNRGLGRWLKATMIQWIIATYPDLERVDTFNAGSNEPMLQINLEMGFEPVHVANAWQGELATVRKRFRA